MIQYVYKTYRELYMICTVQVIKNAPKLEPFFTRYFLWQIDQEQVDPPYEIFYLLERKVSTIFTNQNGR